MNDEPRWLEIDSRLRAALRTNHATCRAIVARALAVTPRTPSPRWRRPFTVATAAALALLLVAGFVWRRSAGRSTSPLITVTSAGPVLIVQSEDGRRWIVGPSMPRHSGSYAMVVSE
jgi:ferric-dicitrate binding protein FerR (iron transport regulator)